MMTRLRDWLGRKWQRRPDPGLLEAYRATFASMAGQMVMQHLMDGVYCKIYEGKDPIEGAHHNGRRSVVQEILENIDMAENPAKYKTEVEHG